MPIVTMTDLRRDFESLVEWAADGEVITVTRRGKPVIQLVKHGQVPHTVPGDSDQGLSRDIPVVKK